MDSRLKAEELFGTMVQMKKTLAEIPIVCSQGETGTLLYLAFVKKEMTASELSQKLNVSLPRITSILNSLETKNMLKKRIDIKDKRKIVVSITENGKNMVLEKKEEAINNMARIIEKLDEKDIDEYIRIAKKIREVIEEMQD